MRSIREIVALFLIVISLWTLPVGLLFLLAGFDGSWELFGWSLVPPLALLMWILLWRGKWGNP